MTIPYGAWPSPISAADRARGSLSLSFPDAVAGSGEVWWMEGRPDEEGRQVVVRAGADGQPLEVQLLEFPSAAALDGYMTDGRRLSLAGERDKAIARTQVMNVELV